jgi:hypothetical protein
MTMRIENLRTERNTNRARVVATVIWEDCDRGTQEIFYETDSAFAEDIWCNPHTFLVGCALPALHHGEERLAMDEAICPELQNGLMTAIYWLSQWFNPTRRPIRIEAKSDIAWPMKRTAQRAGSFLSGGVDSLATLRANRLDFPPDHPRSIKDCLFIHGFDIGALRDGNQELDLFDQAMASLNEIAKDIDVTLIPVYTNVRHLSDEVQFWIYEFHGAALASVGHAFSRRLSTMSIASAFSVPNIRQGGTHPLIDPNYSSTDLQFRHDGLLYSRLDKVRLLSEWDAALRNLRVCTFNRPGKLNCGECEKCVRTMLQLLAVGGLAKCSAFPTNDISPELLSSIRIGGKYQDAWYRDLIEPLTELGRHDLVEVIESKRSDYDRYLAWEREQDWKGTVKRFDRKFLGSSLFNSYRTMRRFFVDRESEGATS